MTESRATFQQQLGDIRRDLLRAGARVTETVIRGTEALLALDPVAAQALIDGEGELDALTFDIEERCFAALASQQIMVSDIRALVTAVHLTSEIERSGDLMVIVAEATHRLRALEIPPPLRRLLQAMSTEAVRLHSLAMDSYADGDADLAAGVGDMDDRLDELHKDYIQAILELFADAKDVHVAVQLSLVGSSYERIGDHAVSIGERVRYMATGWPPEHATSARYAFRAQAPGEST